VIFENDSRIREIRDFWWCKSLHRIEIPASAEIVDGFHSCDSLTEVIFENDSRIREINGFLECKSIHRIEIPGSVEMLCAFRGCTKLKKITFAPTCCLHVIEGFEDSLIRSIEIPASVETIIGFNSRRLSQLILVEGTIIKRIKVGNLPRQVNGCSDPVFVVYGEGDLKKGRRRSTLV
jgi:hypothetical protein